MKKAISRLGLSGLLAANMLLTGNYLLPVNSTFTPNDVRAEAAKTDTRVKGKITNISQKAKTIALTLKDKSSFFVKFTDDTQLKGVKTTRELKVNEKIVVEYKMVAGEHIATSITKAFVKLPKGAKEIKTDALVQLIKNNPNAVVIDARPLPKYNESHIPGAIPIPFAKLNEKDNASELLEKYKDRQLVFYCGGST